MASGKPNTFRNQSTLMWSQTDKAPDSHLLQVFHDASASGDKRRVKRCLKSGVDVDCIDKHGRTALFTACLEGHESVVDLLLKYGANVNQRIPEGSTPLHAASYGSNVRILRKLVELGGDVRLHDVNGLVVRNWAQRQMNISRRKKNVEFLLENQSRALSYAGRSTITSFSSGAAAAVSLKSASDSLKKSKSYEKQKKERCPLNDYIMVNNFGYGPMFISRFGDAVEANGSVPMIRENALQHDENGPTYNYGPYMVMESMLWNKVKVTVKRLHREPVRGGNVDLLISESDISTRLRHSNIMLLMAVCHTSNLENMVLLYERINTGSLFMHVYTQGGKLNEFDVCRVMSQISSALLYVHQRGIVHCALSSHAIQLSDSCAKLSNFEYATRVGSPVGSITPGTKPAPKSVLMIENQLEIVFNWAAPEVLAGHPFTYSSDLYSLCALLWEAMHGVLPWNGLDIGAVRREFAIQGRGLLKAEDVHRPYDNLLRAGLAIDVQSRHVTVEQFYNTLSMALTTSRLTVPQETETMIASTAKDPGNTVSVTSPWRQLKASPRPVGGLSTERQRQRHKLQQQKQQPVDESTDDMMVGAAPLSRLSRRMERRSSRQDDNVLKSSTSVTSKSSTHLRDRALMKSAVQNVSGDSPTVEMALGADINEHSSSLVRVSRSMSATKMAKSSQYTEPKMAKRLEGGDSFESSSTISSRGILRRRSKTVTRISDAEAYGANAEDIIDEPPCEQLVRDFFQKRGKYIPIDPYLSKDASGKPVSDATDECHESTSLKALYPTAHVAVEQGSCESAISAMLRPSWTADYPPNDASDQGVTRCHVSRARETRASASTDYHRQLATNHNVNDMSCTRGARLHETRASSTDNPFRSELLNHETLEMYHAMLNRPLPRLPKLYTLPSRRLPEERPSPRKVVTQSSTMCGTLLRHYSPVFGQQSAGTVATNVPLVNSVDLDPSLCSPDRALIVRNYPPTFGISLNELKAAIAPRASAIQNYCPAAECADENNRKENGIVSASRTSNTDLPLMHIQPASHHRPSIADSAGKAKPLSPMFQRRVTQPLTLLMPTAGSLNSVCPVTVSTSTVGSLSNPLVGVSQQLRPPVTTKVSTTALKTAATMPLPAGLQTEADYMLRFRSDPILLHGDDEPDNDSHRPNPPPCSPVGDYRTNAEPNVELDMDCPSRNVRDLISHYQEQYSEFNNKAESFNSHRQTADAATDPIYEGEFVTRGVPSTFVNSLQTSATVYGAQAVSTCVIGDVTIRKFHRAMEGSSLLAASTQTPPMDAATNKIMNSRDKDIGDPAAKLRNAEQKTSNYMLASRSRSETDEESSHMVSSALKQAKVDIVHKYASKLPADVTAECGNTESLPDRCELMDVADVRRFMMSPLKEMTGANANNNNEFMTASPIDNASRTIAINSNGTSESVDHQVSQEATASVSSTACSCSITTSHGSVTDDFTQSDDRSHGSIIQKIKSITKTLLSSGSSTSSRASSVSDIYFDDEFTGGSLNKQDRHMRLNTTLNLDNPSNDGRFCSPFVAARGCSRECTGGDVKTGELTAVNNNELSSLPGDVTTSYDNKSLDYSHITNSSGRTASTIVIETDEYGQHRISVRKSATTPQSGGRRKTMRTQVILDHDNNTDEQHDSTHSLI